LARTGRRNGAPAVSAPDIFEKAFWAVSADDQLAGTNHLIATNRDISISENKRHVEAYLDSPPLADAIVQTAATAIAQGYDRLASVDDNEFMLVYKLTPHIHLRQRSTRSISRLLPHPRYSKIDLD